MNKWKKKKQTLPRPLPSREGSSKQDGPAIVGEDACLHIPFGRSGKYEDNRTPAQIAALHDVVATLRDCFPDARVVGINELNPLKACPCLSPSAMKELSQAHC